VRELKDLVTAAAAAAEAAGRLLRSLPPLGRDAWMEKAPHDFVTDADRRAEALIADALVRAVPGAVVMGEELSPGAGARAGAGVVWVVDPLDGTTNFLHGYPQYAVSIAAQVDGVLQIGVVHDVCREVTYRAVRGQGAWCGARRLAVSSVVRPGHALIGTGFPFRAGDGLERYLRQLAAVMAAASGVRRAGSAALDLADVAAGRLDAFWELTLAPWDVAAGIVLIREAGGVVTTLAGAADDAEILRGGSIVAGNPVLHRWLLDTLTTA
jgi:myo-inositol-1(or 4)-monophosphatase